MERHAVAHALAARDRHEAAVHIVRAAAADVLLIQTVAHPGHQLRRKVKVKQRPAQAARQHGQRHIAPHRDEERQQHRHRRQNQRRNDDAHSNRALRVGIVLIAV